MSLTKMSAQPGMLTEKLVGAAAFEQLNSFGNAHRRGQTDKDMDVVSLNLKLEEFDTMSFGNLAQKLFAVLANNLKLKGVLSILGLPHKVERVLSDAVLVVYKSFHHFFVPPRIFCGAYATSVGGLSAPAALRTLSITKKVEKYGGKSKVRQIVAIPLRTKVRSTLAKL